MEFTRFDMFERFYLGSQSQVRMEQHKIFVEQHEVHNWSTVKSANNNPTESP